MLLKDKLFLTKTDTTVGFVTQNKEKLDIAKQRPTYKYYITAVNSLKTLNSFTRVPNKYKKLVRRANKTTFIMPNKSSYRVVKDKHHLLLLNRLKWAYTSSANLSGQNYDEAYVRSVADEVIEPLNTNAKPSKILKINNHKVRKIR